MGSEMGIGDRVSKDRVADGAAVLVAATALVGTVFSIYLTFLEPFVIGATCLWCLTSALCIVGLLWFTAGPGWAAPGRFRRPASSTASAPSLIPVSRRLRSGVLRVRVREVVTRYLRR